MVSNRHLVATGITLLLLLLSQNPGQARPREGAEPGDGRALTSASSPCEDAEYRRLLEKPINEMTSAEYAYITAKRRECRRFLASQAAGGDGSSSDLSSPCEDPEYRQLLEKPISEMTSAEYAYITTKRRECRRFLASQAAGGEGSSSATLLPSQPEATGGGSASANQGTSGAWTSSHDSYPQPRIGLSIGAGLAPPTGPMTDYHNRGMSFAAGITYALNERFGIDILSVGLDHFSLDDAAVTSLEQAISGTPILMTDVLPGGSISMLSFLSGVRARLMTGSYVPFLLAGAGLFRASHWDLEITGGEIIEGGSHTSFGMSLGAGIEARVSERSTAYTEVRANFVETGFDRSVYWPVRGGFRYLWR
jgi:opacity protein-like surface antigen